MAGLDFLDDELDALARVGRLRVARTVTSRRGSEVVVDGRTLVNFASNDYLGLALDPRLAAAAAAAEAEHGVGAGASRLISGHTSVTAALEHALAGYLGAGSVRVFNSGYAANTGLMPSLVGPGDVIFSDELNHASLIDGCRLSRARIVVYRHGRVDELEAALGREQGRRRLILTESVFSMDGDVAPLDAIVELGRQHGGITVVDDAHAFGVIGPRGAGLGMASGADVVVATLGKSVGSAGAFVAGPARLDELLWNRARTLIFSTGLSIGTQAAALAGLRIVASPEGDQRRARVRELADSLCASLGISSVAAAVVPVVLGADRAAVAAAADLEAAGFWVPAIRPPTVPEGTARLRVTLSAIHEADAVQRLAARLQSGREMLHVEHPVPPSAAELEMFHMEHS